MGNFSTGEGQQRPARGKVMLRQGPTGVKSGQDGRDGRRDAKRDDSHHGQAF